MIGCILPEPYDFPGLPLDLGNHMGEEVSKYKRLFISGRLYAFGLHDCKFLVTTFLCSPRN